MDTGVLYTVSAEANTVMAPPDKACDTVKAAKSGPDRVESLRITTLYGLQL